MKNKFIDNVKFGEDNELKDYCALLLFAVDQPPTDRGFSPSENVAATKLYSILEKQKDKDRIELTPADLEKVKTAFNNVRFSKRNEEIAEMTDYIDSL